MLIRQATKADIQGVKKIADLHYFSREQPNWQQRKYGFFEHLPISEEQLANVLNPLFTVALTNQGLRGFNLAISDYLLRIDHGTTDDPGLKYVLNNITGRFAYLDMLGVLNPESLGAGRVANNLVDNALAISKRIRLESALAYICISPWFNKRSVNFLTKKGFRKIHELPHSKDIVLGLYQLSLT